MCIKSSKQNKKQVPKADTSFVSLHVSRIVEELEDWVGEKYSNTQRSKEMAPRSFLDQSKEFMFLKCIGKPLQKLKMGLCDMILEDHWFGRSLMILEEIVRRQSTLRIFL